MPKYLNTASYPIFYNGTVFIPNQPVETLDVIMNEGFIFGIEGETYIINAGVNDVLLLRFNHETAWTTVTLTAGGAQTAQQVADDINAAYGSIVAYSEAGRLKIIAPRVDNYLSSVWLSFTGSTANATLGLSGRNDNPAGFLAARQIFLNSTQVEPYNITAANNSFIFKFNNEEWITANLTIGAAQTAQQIANDINLAYRNMYNRSEAIALSVELIAGSGINQLQLLAPVIENYRSSIYIKEYQNTALAVLGFYGDDKYPIIIQGYPQLIRQSVLPLFNPIISSTILTFPGGGWTTFYTNPAINVTKFTFTTVGTAVNIYIEDAHNVPPIPVAAGGTYTFEYKIAKINKFVIEAAGAGSLTILELKS